MEQGLLFPKISLATPLIYFGGKNRAISKLMPYLPAGTEEVVSPFIGGGAMELALTGKGIRVHGYDAFPPLVNFWQKMLTKPNDLLEPIVRFAQDLHDGQLPWKQHIYWDLTDEIEQAAMFLVVNNVSFNSLFFRGVGRTDYWMHPDGHLMRKHNSKLINLDKVRGFHNPYLSVERLDFRESLARHPTAFAYCDPPYPEASGGYGDGPAFHEDFPHDELASILHTRDRWMLSYNDTETVKELYPPSQFNYEHPKWTLSARKDRFQRTSDEVLIRTPRNVRLDNVKSAC